MVDQSERGLEQSSVTRQHLARAWEYFIATGSTEIIADLITEASRFLNNYGQKSRFLENPTRLVSILQMIADGCNNNEINHNLNLPQGELGYSIEKLVIIFYLLFDQEFLAEFGFPYGDNSLGKSNKNVIEFYRYAKKWRVESGEVAEIFESDPYFYFIILKMSQGYSLRDMLMEISPDEDRILEHSEELIIRQRLRDGVFYRKGSPDNLHGYDLSRRLLFLDFINNRSKWNNENICRRFEFEAVRILSLTNVYDELLVEKFIRILPLLELVLLSFALKYRIRFKNDVFQNKGAANIYNPLKYISSNEDNIPLALLWLIELISMNIPIIDISREFNRFVKIHQKVDIERIISSVAGVKFNIEDVTFIRNILAEGLVWTQNIILGEESAKRRAKSFKLEKVRFREYQRAIDES